MNIRALTVAFVFPAMFVLYSPVPVRAGDCKPLQRYTEVDLLRSEDGNAAFVPVTMEGQDKLLLLDTGGFFSEIMPDAVKALNLSTKQSSGLVQYSVSRQQSDQAAIVDKFGIGKLHWDSADFMIATEDHTFGKDADPRIAGILGPNIFKNFDVDLDFGANKLGLMSPDHCEGKVIYWPATAVAVIPMWINSNWHIVIPITLDGVKLNALIDTGASHTTLMLDPAESYLGIKPGDADTPDIGALGGRVGARMYRHRFHSLSFEGISIANPNLDLIPDLLKHALSTGPALNSHISAQDAREFPDLIIGMDVLRHFHIYIAYKEKNLYITPAAPVPAPASGGTPQQSSASQ